MGDYLWDKTGGADPEVERLEELLGSLAHRPRPLELPPGAAAGRRRRALDFARPAAAAALLLAVLAGALVAYRQAGRGFGAVAESGPARESTPPLESAPPREGSAAAPEAPGRREQAAAGEGKPFVAAGEEKPSARAAKASHGSRRPRRNAPAPKAVGRTRVEVAASPRRPAEAERLQAKEQLVYALRLTSVKLDEVRRRVRGGGD